MFVPKLFSVNDFKELIQFIKKHPFATVITANNNVPEATQVPIMVDVVEGEIVLSFHLANANSQCQALVANDQVLIQFVGANGYISSSWYKEEDVSTWNYQTAHLRGVSVAICEDDLLEDLRKLTDYYEASKVNGRVFNTLSDATLHQVKGITGFRVHVTEAQLKYKLSQNRSDADYSNIVLKLKENKDYELAYEMEQLRD